MGQDSGRPVQDRIGQGTERIYPNPEHGAELESIRIPEAMLLPVRSTRKDP